MTSVSKIFNPLWDGLSGREREIVTGRFGLEKFDEAQTLAALGAKYGVTRERVRQIEASALTDLRKKIAEHESAQDVINRCRKFLKDSGGVQKAEVMLAYVNTFAEGMTQNHLNLLLEASKAFFYHPENKNFRSFFYLDRDSLKTATSFINQWTSQVKGRKDEVLGGAYSEHLASFIKKSGFPSEHAETYLNISTKIGKNPYGDVGLSEWAEIQPKTVRDRIYLTLKKEGAPLHFRTIATMINKIGFNSRTASAPTVHNELIKDGRFVLVGRGTYALAEKGYEPGTAREVIHRILRKHGALRPKEVMFAVQKERFFKPNTILVNLQNKSFFKRLPDGTYKVREA